MTDHSELSTLLQQAIAADLDPQETREWLDALAEVLAREGEGRAKYLLKRLTEAARGMGGRRGARPHHALPQHHRP